MDQSVTGLSFPCFLVLRVDGVHLRLSLSLYPEGLSRRQLMCHTAFSRGLMKGVYVKRGFVRPAYMRWSS